MKKSNITVKENGTLAMTKTFYKKACVFGSAEYYELRQAKAENEGYEVVFTYQVSDKKTYKALTLARMEAYIKSQPDSESRLMEFKAVQEIAKIKGSTYPLTKKWFLLTYPEFKENSVSEREQEETLAGLKAEAKKRADAKAEAKKQADAKAEAEKKMSLITGDLAPAVGF